MRCVNLKDSYKGKQFLCRVRVLNNTQLKERLLPILPALLNVQTVMNSKSAHVMVIYMYRSYVVKQENLSGDEIDVTPN